MAQWVVYKCEADAQHPHKKPGSAGVQRQGDPFWPLAGQSMQSLDSRFTGETLSQTTRGRVKEENSRCAALVSTGPGRGVHTHTDAHTSREHTQVYLFLVYAWLTHMCGTGDGDQSLTQPGCTCVMLRTHAGLPTFGRQDLYSFYF